MGSQNHTANKSKYSIVTLVIGTAITIRKREANENCSFVRNPHVSLYPSQIRRLKDIARRDGKRLTQLVREAVGAFLNKRTYERSTFNFSPPRTKALRRIYPLLPKSVWDSVTEISKRSSRPRAELVRDAVDDYLRKSP